jgi:hypothetical protein
VSVPRGDVVEVLPKKEEGGQAVVTPQTKEPGRGRFKPGPDPRRHKFTKEECSKGFWAAIESVVSRYPEASNNGRHIACNFLPAILARKRKGLS